MRQKVADACRTVTSNKHVGVASGGWLTCACEWGQVKQTPTKQNSRARYQARLLKFSCCDSLEAFLQRNVPYTTTNVGSRFVVAVFEGAGNEGRISIENVVHAQCDGRAIQPCSPATLVVGGGANWH